MNDALLLTLVTCDLGVDDRARVACVSRAWRTAERDTVVLHTLKTGANCSTLTDDALAALCARAGPVLRELDLSNLVPDERGQNKVTPGGLVAALRAGGCVAVRHVRLPLWVHEYGYAWHWAFTAEQATDLGEACPALERVEGGAVQGGFMEALLAVNAVPFDAVVCVVDYSTDGERVIDFASDNDSDIDSENDSEEVIALAARGLSEHLRRPECLLQSVSVVGARVDDACVGVIADALCVNTSVRHLNFKGAKTGSQVGEEGSAHLARMLRINNSITSLDLTLLNEAPLDDVFDSIAYSNKVNNVRLARLVLDDVELSTEAMSALKEMLRDKDCGLEFLSMKDWSYSFDMSEDFGASLGANTSLVRLNLSGNHIFFEETEHIGAFLFANTTLRALDLSDNFLGRDCVTEEDFRYLARGLRHNTGLTALSLRNNSINYNGVRRIAKALASNTTLRALDFRGNDTSHHASQAFAQCIRRRRAPLRVVLTEDDLIDEE